MDHICRMYDRNYIVEKYLYLIDRVIYSNWALMRISNMDYDDVFQ